jgi:hypothetical protein
MRFIVQLTALGLLVATPCAAPCATLGRLFSSPAERAQLDALRQAGATGNPAPMPPAAMEPPAPQAIPEPPPEPVFFNGSVQRSGGKGTAWVNAIPQDDDGRAGPAQPAYSLRLPSGKEVILRPGQRYDPFDDKVKDVNAP